MLIQTFRFVCCEVVTYRFCAGRGGKGGVEAKQCLLSVNSLHFDVIILSVDWKIIKYGT